MITRKIRLGPNELRLLFTLEKEGKVAFLTSDAHRILRSSGASVNNVLYRLRSKGRIEEIEKGKYLLIPAKAGYEGVWAELPFLIVPHLIGNYYIGFWSALNYWGMTEQVPNTVLVATTKRKRRLEYGNARFEFITLSKKRFFGFKEETVAGSIVNISTKEKTIIDCLAFPENCGGLDEAAKGIWSEREELDYGKLVEFSIRFGVNVVVRRLAYLLDLLEIDNKETSRLAKMKFKGFAWLDPLGPKRVLEYSKKYGLMINRTKKELTHWMGY